MIYYEDYIAGWLDSSIHEFLQALPPSFESMEFALITCVDSNSDVASLLDKSPELKSLKADSTLLGRGLLLPTRRLLEVESGHPIFFGFDEVWFFPRERIEPKPESIFLVGPARIDQNKMNELGAWMVANACSLAFGDGEGLNFIVKASRLVKHLLGHSNSQPVPTFRNAYVFEEENAGGSLVP